MIVVRPLDSQAELAEAVRLQKEIWGFEDRDLLPIRFFVVAGKVGGQVLGAFDGSRMAGFLIAIPGVKPGGVAYLHSHMMGVVPEYRNKGVGRQLKLRQRDEALQRGFELIEWTFDPLEVKNAFFNIERLGAVVRRFVLNQYGTTSSRLHSGLPTDRCVAEWHIGSRRVELLLRGERPLIRPIRRVELPTSIAHIRSSDPEQARSIQATLSAEFLDATAEGFAATGFESDTRTSAYLLEPWESE